MRILVTNDDGINAPGLATLQDIASKLTDDVWTIAPELDQSGASHSLTLREPLRMREVGERTFAVRGTPSDCVIMGTRHVLRDHRPDVVLSGVNRGSNMAEDVNYSGTVAGASEGALLGIKSVALSQAGNLFSPGDIRWQTPAVHAPPLLEKLLKVDWAPGILLNINFPDCDPEDVGDVEITRQGRRDLESLVVDARKDTWGNPYYWFGYERRRLKPPEGTDLFAVFNGRISVTPLSLDRTDPASSKVFERAL